MEDTQIIDLYFSRSESAITETARKYGHYLHQISYNILRCREDTEEIVDDTYLTAWNTIPPEIPNVLKHYLSRITRNLSFNKLDYNNAKCRNPNMILLLSELDTCLPDRNADIEASLEAKHIGIMINRFLSKQIKQDCAIFLCRYYHCMNIREIADKYQLSERQVKYRLSCIRKSLRAFLDKEGIVV